MNRLDEAEHQSVYIIREAFREFGKIGLLWSVGKDSTVLLWLCRKAFFGRLPFPVVHIDTGYKFPEMIAWRDRYAAEWGLELIVGRNEEAIKGKMGPTDKLACCTALKTEALKQTIRAQGFRALLLGIRRDEHGIRAKERVFSPRDGDFRWDYGNQPPELWDQYQTRQAEEGHTRVHPLLHWSETDVWEYTQREGIPVVPLYYARDNTRYRSIGCACCCAPVASDAADIASVIRELRSTNTAERAGRAQDKESAYMMQKLRALGYM